MNKNKLNKASENHGPCHLKLNGAFLFFSHVNVVSSVKSGASSGMASREFRSFVIRESR